MNNRPPEDPVDRLRDELHRRGWTQQKFAHIIGRPAQAISEMATGKKMITRITAVQFAAVLDTPAAEWLRLQDAYMLWQMERDMSLQAEVAMIRDRASRA